MSLFFVYLLGVSDGIFVVTVDNIAAMGILVRPRALGRLLVDSEVVIVRLIRPVDRDGGLIRVRGWPVTLAVRGVGLRSLGLGLRCRRLDSGFGHRCW